VEFNELLIWSTKKISLSDHWFWNIESSL